MKTWRRKKSQDLRFPPIFRLLAAATSATTLKDMPCWYSRHGRTLISVASCLVWIGMLNIIITLPMFGLGIRGPFVCAPDRRRLKTVHVGHDPDLNCMDVGNREESLMTLGCGGRNVKAGPTWIVRVSLAIALCSRLPSYPGKKVSFLRYSLSSRFQGWIYNCSKFQFMCGVG